MLLVYSIGKYYNSSLYLGGVLYLGHVTFSHMTTSLSSRESSTSPALRASLAESCFRSSDRLLSELPTIYSASASLLQRAVVYIYLIT